MSASLGNAADDLAVKVGERREQRHGAVVHQAASAVVRVARRQPRFSALQGQTMRPVVAAQCKRPVGWVQVQTDHIPEVDLGVLVAGDLGGARGVRREAVGTPNTVYLSL